MKGQRPFEKELTEILLTKKSLSPKEASALSRAFERSDADQFDEFLLDENVIPESALLDALADYYQVPSFDVVGYFFDTFLLRKFPKGFLLRQGIIPLSVDETALSVIASNPSDGQLLEELARFVSYDIYLLVGLRRNICDAVKEFYDTSETVIPEDGDTMLYDEFPGRDSFDYFEE
jgi:hypothetical protein